jgi:hypothetical protein
MPIAETSFRGAVAVPRSYGIDELRDARRRHQSRSPEPAGSSPAGDVLTVHYEAVCGSSVVLHNIFAFSRVPFASLSRRPSPCAWRSMQRRGERDGPSAQALPTDLVGQRWCSWSLLLSSSRGGSGVSRFGFSRLFELSTPFSLPSAGISCASSQEFIQQGRAAHSIYRSRGSDGVSELHAAPKPKRQSNPTPDSSFND